MTQEERDEREVARLGLAQPEIDALNSVEIGLTSLIASQVMTTAQALTAWSEWRKVIELRATLTGAMPAREVENGNH